MSYLDPLQFETDHQGKSIKLFLLTNSKGNEVWITNYGARVVAIRIPDAEGKPTDVVLGYNTIHQYFEDKTYQGAAIGRFANRISKGRFSIDNTQYQVSTNLNGNCLHGGFNGFHNKVWEVSKVDHSSIELTAVCPDGEDGFPGNLNVKCSYSFTDDNELIFDCSASTNKDTIVNFTQHNYFNLMGEGKGDILDHELMINASLYDHLNDESICENDPTTVENTPFDFRQIKKIGQDINKEDAQLKIGNGYDHNYHLDNVDGSLKEVAKVIAPNGITLTMLTNQPCMQLYTSNWYTGEDIGKSGSPYIKHAAFCLEPQVAPNAPNRPKYNKSVLRVEEEYRCLVVQKFGLE
jgi:aldose 1-epimerase